LSGVFDPLPLQTIEVDAGRLDHPGGVEDVWRNMQEMQAPCRGRTISPRGCPFDRYSVGGRRSSASRR
jgi:hypothetical protein